MRMPRIRFSIRIMMCLVLIFGGGIGWILHRARIQSEAVQEIQRAGGRVFYDWELTNGRPTRKASPWPGWLVKAVGYDLFGNVVGVIGVDIFRNPTTTGLTDDGMAAVGRLPRLEFLNLRGCHITNEGLMQLGGLNRLKYIDLSQTQVTKLAPLQNLVNIEYLGLSESAISESDWVCLSRFRNLERLDLSNTSIQDHQLNRLAGLTRLKSLQIDGTAISDRSVPLLSTILPPAGTLSCHYSLISKFGVSKLKGIAPSMRVYSD